LNLPHDRVTTRRSDRSTPRSTCNCVYSPWFLGYYNVTVTKNNLATKMARTCKYTRETSLIRLIIGAICGIEPHQTSMTACRANSSAQRSTFNIQRSTFNALNSRLLNITRTVFSDRYICNIFVYLIITKADVLN
jgi:hypothetical protein